MSLEGVKYYKKANKGQTGPLIVYIKDKKYYVEKATASKKLPEGTFTYLVEVEELTSADVEVFHSYDTNERGYRKFYVKHPKHLGLEIPEKMETVRFSLKPPSKDATPIAYAIHGKGVIQTREISGEKNIPLYEVKSKQRPDIIANSTKINNSYSTVYQRIFVLNPEGLKSRYDELFGKKEEKTSRTESPERKKSPQPRERKPKEATPTPVVESTVTPMVEPTVTPVVTSTASPVDTSVSYMKDAKPWVISESIVEDKKPLIKTTSYVCDPEGDYILVSIPAVDRGKRRLVKITDLRAGDVALTSENFESKCKENLTISIGNQSYPVNIHQADDKIVRYKKDKEFTQQDYMQEDRACFIDRSLTFNEKKGRYDFANTYNFKANFKKGATDTLHNLGMSIAFMYSGPGILLGLIHPAILLAPVVLATIPTVLPVVCGIKKVLANGIASVALQINQKNHTTQRAEAVERQIERVEEMLLAKSKKASKGKNAQPVEFDYAQIERLEELLLTLNQGQHEATTPKDKITYDNATQIALYNRYAGWLKTKKITKSMKREFTSEANRIMLDENRMPTIEDYHKFIEYRMSILKNCIESGQQCARFNEITQLHRQGWFKKKPVNTSIERIRENLKTFKILLAIRDYDANNEKSLGKQLRDLLSVKDRDVFDRIHRLFSGDKAELLQFDLMTGSFDHKDELEGKEFKEFMAFIAKPEVVALAESLEISQTEKREETKKTKKERAKSLTRKVKNVTLGVADAITIGFDYAVAVTKGVKYMTSKKKKTELEIAGIKYQVISSISKDLEGKPFNSYGLKLGETVVVHPSCASVEELEKYAIIRFSPRKIIRDESSKTFKGYEIVSVNNRFGLNKKDSSHSVIPCIFHSQEELIDFCNRIKEKNGSLDDFISLEEGSETISISVLHAMYNDAKNQFAGFGKLGNAGVNAVQLQNLEIKYAEYISFIQSFLIDESKGLLANITKSTERSESMAKTAKGIRGVLGKLRALLGECEKRRENAEKEIDEVSSSN
ncbi:MAG: hypothetical protein E7374_00395 [Clostridiales bacterium]|nr:hypothetical protein [Clostridiales bacterium]